MAAHAYGVYARKLGVYACARYTVNLLEFAQFALGTILRIYACVPTRARWGGGTRNTARYVRKESVPFQLHSSKRVRTIKAIGTTTFDIIIQIILC